MREKAGSLNKTYRKEHGKKYRHSFCFMGYCHAV
ncbi:MAG: zinc-finger domain-containing protein [Mucilaginibacter sp.]